MIITRAGAQVRYNGVTYTVGGKVLANERSDYQGLYGIIKMICYGPDWKPGDDTPDIYCEFMPPIVPNEIKAFEERFSALHWDHLTIDEIRLESVVMAPEMLDVLTQPTEVRSVTVYAVEEEWAISGSDYGKEASFFLDEAEARAHLTGLVYNEKMDGCIAEWELYPNFETEVTPLSYKGWIQDDYCENHYEVSIISYQTCIGHEQFESIGRRYVDGILRQHFSEQIEDWEELEGLSDAQIQEMIASPEVPERIRKQLDKNGSLVESYWESVSEASFDLVKKFREDQE